MEEGCMEHDILESILDRSIKPRDLRLSLLEKITGNFSEERKIGEGGFAIVYKGILQNGEVAVKRIRNNQTIDETLFRREVTSLMKVNHQNVVRFLGFCSNTEHKAIENKGDYIYAENRERLLCFEYINNGSLDKYITDELRGLEWNTRYNIIKGICKGLEYLHVKRHIIHMDLKPANILLDNHMASKIADFGLSRMDENSRTTSTNRFLSLGYCAPEYLRGGKMSVKSDMYSLGVIIIEMVTGRKDIPNNNNVRRRWTHRWKKSAKGTSLVYQQIAKLIEIGLRCQEHDPYKRPSISEIIHDINELESTDRQISNAKESTFGQISPYSEDDMLGIEPIELRFPFEPEKQTSCLLELTNETNTYIAFSIQTTSLLAYSIKPSKEIVPPQSKCGVNITFQPLDKVPHDKQHTGDFVVRSTKVNKSLKAEDITEDIFNTEEGKVVDEVNLTVVHEPPEPHGDLSLESLTISGSRNLNSPEESNVPPAEAESTISPSSSDDLIQFDPPQLCFPLLTNKEVLSSVKIVNITDFHVGFNIYYLKANAAKYRSNPSTGILRPRSTQVIMVRRKVKEDALKDTQFNDKYFVWNSIMVEGTRDIDLSDCMDDEDSKELPIALTEISSCTSNDLIQFDPPELNFPCLPNKVSISSVNIENITDYYVGFNPWWSSTNVGLYATMPYRGILPPQSTKKIFVRRVANEMEIEDKQCEDKFFVWNMIVVEGVKASNLNHTDDQDSKELPIYLKKISPCTSNDLIRFDPPELCFPFLPNKTSLSSVNMVNITDYSVYFRNLSWKTNKAWYYTEPKKGIVPPQSTQKLVVKRVTMENELGDVECKDKYFVRNAIVTEDVKAVDFFVGKEEGPEWPIGNLCGCFPGNKEGAELQINHTGYCCRWEEEVTELPIVLAKISPSTSSELIQIEPRELYFPFSPNKNLSSSIKIVNITDYYIGFNTFGNENNVALYDTEPPCGILTPRSTQELVVTRLGNGEALEDMQCKDMYFIWSSFVCEGVDAINLKGCTSETESKELPIVFTAASSNDLIQFDPPELCFPLLPNKSVLSSAKILNITDHYIGFNICAKKSNSGRYYTNPSEGILPPRSMQVLMVTREAEEKEVEDAQFKDKYLVWNGIVSEGVKASEVVDNMSETNITELPIVLTKTGSSISDELIQLDPPELCFPFLPNMKVLSSINIVNITDYYIGFNTYTWQTNAAWYHTEPLRGILPPHTTRRLMVTREEKNDSVKGTQFNDKYFVWNSIVTEGVNDMDLTNYKVEQESKELPIVLTKTSLSTSSDELIQFDPTELCLPIFPNRTSMSKINLVNITDYYVGFNIYNEEKNVALCTIEPGQGILQPGSTQKLLVKRAAKEKNLEDLPCKDSYLVWNRIVTKCVEASDIIDYKIKEESKELPIILQKTNLPTSNELIQFDPPEHCFPFFPNQRVPVVRLVNVVNVTDHYVSFAAWTVDSSAMYYTTPWRGILSPRSTQTMIVERVPKEKEPTDMHCKDQLFVWYGIVTEGIKVSDLNEYEYYEGNVEETTELPIVLTKTSLSTSDELIQFDPPELCFPYLPNKRVSVVCLLKIVNVTDHCVGFGIRIKDENSAWYNTDPLQGILPPRSTQVIKVKRTPKDKEPQDMECKDQIYVWNTILNEDVKNSDLYENWYSAMNKNLPIILTKRSLCTSSELIQFDPPQLRFPFLPNKRVSMLCSFKIVNVTDHSIGFSLWVHDDNSALYQMEPEEGIMPPQSTQIIKVKRTLKDTEPQDMKCKDKIGVWSVIEGLEVSDVYWNKYQEKELPIVVTKPGVSSSM